MDIRRLRAFRTIVETGGLTKAAGLLHMTPGALSKSMRQLERETGKRLFMKQGRGLRLTEDGQLLFQISGPLIEEHGRVLRELDASRVDTARTLRLTTYEVFSTHCLGALLDAGLADRQVHVLEQRIGALEQAIVERQADIGITYAPIPQRGLTFRPIGDIDFRIFVKDRAFRDVPFDRLPFAIPMSKIDDVLSDILGIDCWPYERVPRLVRYRLTSLESALELCRRGLCAVFLPAFLVAIHNDRSRHDNRLATYPEPAELGPVIRKVHIVHRDGDAGDEAIDAVSAAMAAMLKRAAAGGATRAEFRP